MTQTQTGSTSIGAPPADDEFVARHIGPSPAQVEHMLATIGVASLDELIDQAVPASIRFAGALDLPGPRSERDVIAELRDLARQNRVRHQPDRDGLHEHDHAARDRTERVREPGLVHRVHAVSARDQPGSARGPAQLPDDGRRADRPRHRQRLAARRGDGGGGGDDDGPPPRAWRAATASSSTTTRTRRRSRCSTTRAEPVGIELVVGDVDALADGTWFGALFSYPTSTGSVTDWTAAIEAVHSAGGLAIVATDLLACVIITPPGQIGADIVVGSAQRFGVPMGFGGPHAGFIAAGESAARALPGRLVGVSTDTAGRPALAARAPDPRAAHPAREGDIQHLHRPGPAGQHRRSLRRLARSRGPRNASPGGCTGSRRRSRPGCGRPDCASATTRGSTRSWSTVSTPAR